MLLVRNILLQIGYAPLETHELTMVLALFVATIASELGRPLERVAAGDIDKVTPPRCQQGKYVVGIT